MKEAILYSSLSGLSTFLGTLLVLLWGSLSRATVAFTLGLSSSVMLMVAYFDLLPTALSVHGTSWPHLTLGMSAGLLTMIGVHQGTSFLHRGIREEREAESYRRLGMYLAVAVMVHNGPEGAAIGIGFGTKEELGLTLAAAMALHNVPEGIGMAAPLTAAGHSRRFVALISLLSGGALPLGTWFGMEYILHSPDVVAVGLIFAMTTMMWVVVREVGPRAWGLHPQSAWIGAGLGLVLMLLLHRLHGG